MKLIVETAEITEKALIIYKDSSALASALEKKIDKYDITTTQTTTIPYSFNDIDYIFTFLDSYSEGELTQLFEARKKTLVVTPHKKIFEEFEDLIKKNHLSNIKVILASLDESDEDVIERILWFMLSSSQEISLNIYPTLPPVKEKKDWKPTIKITKQKATVAGICMLIAMHTFFLIPLAASSYFITKAGYELKDQKFEEARNHIDRAQPLVTLTQGSYVLAKPGLQFLLLSVVPESLLRIQKDAVAFISTALNAAENAHALSELVLAQDKSPEQVAETQSRMAEFQDNVLVLEETSQSLYDLLDYNMQSVQEVRKELETISSYLRTGGTLVSSFDQVLSSPDEKEYIFFFYNNMEIRPGGGFIGSFARVKFQQYTLKEFDVFDVYDADGQLKVHVRPPSPIRDYLDQPHWFLRDSNFSPDFEQNVETAEYFLERELGISNIDGAVAITTTALSYILEAFDELYIADYQETITADNFYLIAQSQAEDDFFPGSTAKKSFLSTVGRTLMLKMNSANPAKLGLGIKRALDEKHIVFLSRTPEIQQRVDVLGWSGKILNPQCTVSSANCIVNHVLPIDANLGVNKANYYVSRLMKMHTTIHNDGLVSNDFSIAYTNTSSEGIQPGGTYKNYYQVYIPHNADVTRIDIDGRRIRTYDVSQTGFFKNIGVYLEIPPQNTSIVTISYDLEETVKAGNNAYQLVLQKQIGAFNSDFSLEIDFPDNTLITDTNFKSIEKNGSVFYNSNLSTNKIFVIEFVKE